MEKMLFNKCQSSLEDLELHKYPDEVVEDFLGYLHNVPFIRWMVSPERPLVSELPRDEEGKVFIDVTKPPILENSDFFRQSALTWQKNGQYTHLRPNRNPSSDFGRWIREERRRGWDGYIDPSTGMWVTGDYYWMLNYCPMHLVVEGKNGLKMRSMKHPRFWDGQFLVSHYIQQSRRNGHHSAYLASRGRGKTSFAASMLAKRFIIGEGAENKEDVQCMVTASDRTKLIGTNQILDVFIDDIDFCAKNTQFPRRRTKSSVQELMWEMGFKKKDSQVTYGSKNSVSGIISGVNQDKLNGSRGVLYLVEEAGIFRNLREMYNMIRPSTEQGEDTFGQIIAYGTSGNDESDFTAFAEMFYSPNGYNLNPLDNVFDKEGQGRLQCCMFYPAYMNYDDSCIDKNGNSNITKALLTLCYDRFKVKYGSSDISTITRRVSQYPITPQEAIIRSQRNIFPVTELNERLNQIDNNPNEYDGTYVGELVFNADNKVEFVPTVDSPIRDFPTPEGDAKGAIEIFEMPQKNAKGEVPSERYILGLDPFDYDATKNQKTMSLGSVLVLDLWTDRIVAEYTGRPMFADDLYEIVRKLCLFYNGKTMYEAHPYSQEVITPNGKKLWKDINIGDKLFSTNGRIVEVIAVPVDEYMPIYKVTLNDGREVMCSDNHIWSVYLVNRQHQGLKSITTKQMMAMGLKTKHGQTNFFVPNGGIVEYEHREVPIDPYTLGLLIAEGAFTKFKKGKYEKFKRRMVQFSSTKEDAEFYKTAIPYPIKYIGTKGYSWHMYINDIDIILKRLGLLHKNSLDKFIPDLYLYNDSNVRLELLKGLMDGDGCAYNKGAAIYITSSKQLKTDFMSLCRSLGINCKCVTYEPHITKSPNNGKEYLSQTSYHIYIYADKSIFKLPRKKNAQYVYQYDKKGCKANGYVNKTAIISIEFSHYEQGKCITVNQDDGLYMVGDYVVTHNCNLKGTFSYFSTHSCLHLLADTPEYLKDKQLVTVIGVGNKSKGVHATVPIIQFGFKLIRDWLLKPVPRIEKDTEGNDVEVMVPNLYNVKNRAFIQELIQWNPRGNYDRCVLEDTQIQTKNGIKEIKDIVLKDSVLTMDGKYNEVCQLHKNTYTGTIYKFRAMGDYRHLNCTYNHPIACRHREVIPKGRYYMKNRNKMSSPEYKEAQNITKDDFVLVPKRVGLPYCSIPDDKLYLLGWYIADGNASVKNKVIFKLQGDQYEIAKEIKRMLDKYWARDYTFVDGSVRQWKNRTITQPAHNKRGHVEAIIHQSYSKHKGKRVNCWEVTISSKEAQEFFVKYGGGPNHKDIADSIYNTRGLLPLIKGFFEGDGHYRCEVRCDGSLRNSLELNSVYEKLIHKVRQILLDEGIWCTVRKVVMRGYMAQEQYNLNIVNDNVIPIIKGSLKFKQLVPKHNRTVKEHHFEDALGFWVKLKDITSYNYSGDVYNIGVRNNHSYCANGMLTHNCMATVQLMLYREEKMILYQGDLRHSEVSASSLETDDYWVKNYPKKDDVGSKFISMEYEKGA